MSDGYKAPEVEAYGSVEAVTEARNKATLGEDTDVKAVNLKGSVGFV